jgi:hypothetical protein
MPHKYYVFTSDSESSTPLDATIVAAHDSGWSGTAVAATDPPGRKGKVFDVPDTVPDKNGCQLDITLGGYTPTKTRELLTYVGDRAYLQCDDFRLVKLPVVQPPTPPPNPNPSTPLEVINAVYATGQFNLATHTGCGQFTEECCRQLATAFGAVWGHVAKSPGQNQYQNHAVDAVMSLAGPDHGIWDIIVSSVSSSARPAFNRAGDSKPELWRPPAPLPCQAAVTAVRVTIDLSFLDDLLLLVLAVLKRKS